MLVGEAYPLWFPEKNGLGGSPFIILSAAPLRLMLGNLSPSWIITGEDDLSLISSLALTCMRSSSPFWNWLGLKLAMGIFLIIDVGDCSCRKSERRLLTGCYSSARLSCPSLALRAACWSITRWACGSPPEVWLLNSLVEGREVVCDDELVGERAEEGGEWTLKNF